MTDEEKQQMIQEQAEELLGLLRPGEQLSLNVPIEDDEPTPGIRFRHFGMSFSDWPVVLAERL